MKIRILYQTQYAYEETVTFSPHLFRLFPKTGSHLKVHGFNFQTNLNAGIHYRRDLFDNEVASCFYPEPSGLLAASFDLDLEVQEKNAFGFLVDAHATSWPFTYKPEELRVLQSYLDPGARLELPFWKRPADGTSTVSMLIGLNDALHDNLAYERREEGRARPPLETIALLSGACRDFATLMMEMLQGLGLAARLASGYLCEFGDLEKVAEGALHAWVEVYLPGAGWTGLDPTNGSFCDHHHLTAAVGLTPADISPVLGSYYSPKHVPAMMSASLQILPHE